MGFGPGVLPRCIILWKALFFIISPRRNRSTVPSQTVLLFSPKKPTQPSQHFSSLVPLPLSGPLASMDEWQLQSLASSCSPCMEACSITKTGWRWCVSVCLQTILPRITLHTSAISQIPTPGADTTQQHLIGIARWAYGIKLENIHVSLISEKTKCIVCLGEIWRKKSVTAADITEDTTRCTSTWTGGAPVLFTQHSVPSTEHQEIPSYRA